MIFIQRSTGSAGTRCRAECGGHRRLSIGSHARLVVLLLGTQPAAGAQPAVRWTTAGHDQPSALVTAIRDRGGLPDSGTHSAFLPGLTVVAVTRDRSAEGNDHAAVGGWSGTHVSRDGVTITLEAEADGQRQPLRTRTKEHGEDNHNADHRYRNNT